MESLLLSVVSKYLKEYVNNFSKEKMSMNFLRGHGVIRDLDINVDAINEMVFHQAPGLRFSSILINTLSIEAPIMSLHRSPHHVAQEQTNYSVHIRGFYRNYKTVESIKKHKRTS